MAIIGKSKNSKIKFDIYVLCTIAVKNILLCLACAFKKVILQSSNSIYFTLPVAFQVSSIYDALCGC